MSATVTDAESPVSVAHQINANYYLNLVAFTILYFDYLVTLGDEVEFFWRRRTNTASILYFVNRYVSILGTVPVFLQTFCNWSSKGCDNLQKYHQFLSILVQIVVAVMVILRTYALYELQLKVLLALSSFTVIAVWTVLGHSPVLLEPYNLSSFPGCHTLISAASGNRLAGAWGALFVFDTVIVILTLLKAIKIRRLEDRTLFRILIRDGTIYYFVFSLVNLAQIFLFVIGTPLLRGVCTTFANVVSTTLISRLMLNLKNPRLFRPGPFGGSTLSTLGAFVASPGGHDESLSDSSTMQNSRSVEWTRDSTLHSYTRSLLNRASSYKQRDIELDLMSPAELRASEDRQKLTEEPL